MATDQARNPAAVFDVRAPAFLQDPYPFYACQRETAPAFWSDGAWGLTRYADVFTALRDPRFAADAVWLSPTAPLHPAVEPLRQEMLALRAFARHWLLLQNPSDHPRLRAVLSGAFTPRVIAGLRPASRPCHYPAGCRRRPRRDGIGPGSRLPAACAGDWRAAGAADRGSCAVQGLE